MIPDYLTSYKHQLESYETILTVKLTALQGFVSAVTNDWEFIRKKRALMRLDEIQESLKKLDRTASVSEVINLLPSDLPRVYNTVWKLLAILTPDYVPRPATDGEVSMSSFFRNPLVAPLLPLTFDNVRKQIQATPIPEVLVRSAHFASTNFCAFGQVSKWSNIRMIMSSLESFFPPSLSIRSMVSLRALIVLISSLIFHHIYDIYMVYLTVLSGHL